MSVRSVLLMPAFAKLGGHERLGSKQERWEFSSSSKNMFLDKNKKSIMVQKWPYGVEITDNQ